MQRVLMSWRPRWHWHRFDALPVTFHLRRDFRFHWTRLCGVQVGPWFFGAVRGVEVNAQLTPASREE